MEYSASCTFFSPRANKNLLSLSCTSYTMKHIKIYYLCPSMSLIGMFLKKLIYVF